MITKDNFSSTNRDKVIGNSIYRICQKNDTKKWYIHEVYNDKTEWACGNAYFNEELEPVLNIFNSIKEEKEVINNY